MGRRSDHTHEELKDLTVKAAMGIVAQGGARQLTVRKVAAEIGYSVGTIYNLFEDLEGLGLAVRAQTLEALYHYVKAIPRGQDALEDCLALNHAYFKFLDDHANSWRFVLDRSGRSADPAPAWYLQKVSLPFSVLEGALKPLLASDAEYMDPVSSRHIIKSARTLWAGVHGIAALSLNNNLSAIIGDDPEEMAAYLIKTFIAGLQSREG